jgi:hypothetical protein
MILNSMEFIDGELTMLDHDGNVIHVFERGDFSRAAYKFISKKVFEKYFSEISPEENWKRAEAEWDALTPEMQAHLWSLSRQEEQCGEDIRQGLLATLNEYRGFKFIKDLFADAIKCVKF